MPEAVFQTRSLSIGYRQRGKHATVVSSDINLAARRGELVCLLGPNGAGKSTFLRTMAAMQPALEGEVLLEGRDVHRIDPRELVKRLSVVLTERHGRTAVGVCARVARSVSVHGLGGAIDGAGPRRSPPLDRDGRRRRPRSPACQRVERR